MTETKITGLTALNVRAINETIPVDLGVTTTATTATFRMSARDAERLVATTISRLPGRGHPKHSLHAVRRKLENLIVREAVAIRYSGNDPRRTGVIE